VCGQTIGTEFSLQNNECGPLSTPVMTWENKSLAVNLLAQLMGCSIIEHIFDHAAHYLMYGG
jgi:hypothetical protein